MEDAETYIRINENLEGYRLNVNERGHSRLGYWSPPT